MLQRVRAAGAEISAGVGVGIDVNRGVLAQLSCVRLRPSGRAEQHGLFAVPSAVDDGALRLPALLHQLAQRAGFLQQRHLAGDRVPGAVHPGIVMIAAHDPAIGIARSGNFCNHIVHLLDVPIRLHYQVHFRRPRANMIWNRQRSTPLLRRQRPGNGGQQRLGVAIRNR